jgi:hypothetical protein
MKKIIMMITLLISAIFIVGCQNTGDTIETEPDYDAYQLLMDAEDLSGMADKTKSVIRENGSLGLPTSYQGVTITYSSRNKDVISDEGVVIRPNECWIESRDQQGLNPEDYADLNNDWPIVVDVTFTYEGFTRTAKLLFVVAPSDGFTCNKYLG